MIRYLMMYVNTLNVVAPIGASQNVRNSDAYLRKSASDV